MISMTGYGMGTHVVGAWECVTELRSVNHRFLDIKWKLPPTVRFYEELLTKILRKSCFRGKIEVSITLVKASTTSPTIRLNQPLLEEYAQILRQVEELSGTPVSLQFGDLLKIPDLIQTEEVEMEEELLQQLLQTSVENALREMQAMRKKEGEWLYQELLHRVNQCLSAINSIEGMAKNIAKSHYERLLSNLKGLDSSVEYSQERVHQEIAIYAERVDITEEVVRFKTHLIHCKELMQQNVVGKKLDFLVQELNREANTIGAKANNASISHEVVQVKNDLEKMREQIQNIE